MWARIACVVAGLGSTRVAQQELDKLIATEGMAGDSLGIGVDVDGPTCVAGAMHSGLAIDQGGAAYVFLSLDGASWTQVATLTPSTPDSGAQFGRSVGVSGDVVMVGATQDDAAEQLGGAVYVYERDEGGPGAWGEVQRLIPADVDELDQFGFDVAVDGDWAIVGSPGDDDAGGNAGAAYIYMRGQDGVWAEAQKLVPGEISILADAGWSVAIDGDTAVVGSRRDDSQASNAGSAFVYRLIGGDWVQVAKIYSDDLEAGDWFGEAVAIDGDVIVVGARNEDELGGSAGAAYVFERDAGGPEAWGQTAKLIADDGIGGDLLGEAVAVEGDRVLVGAPNAANDSGVVYVYGRAGQTWAQTGSFDAADTGGNDAFGTDVGMASGLAIVGAIGDDPSGAGSGSAYVFGFGCAADFNGDGAVNILDFVAFQQAFVTADPSADCDANGAFNILDFVCFQQVFAAGCG